MPEFQISQRLQRLPPYLFAEIDRKKSELRKAGIKFTDLSIGDPDILAPESIVEELHRAAKLKENQKYSLDQGKYNLRQGIKVWFKQRFNVDLDENNQILPIIGSKEGLVHFPLGVVNKGDYVIIPNPGYPGYRAAAIFAEAKFYDMPLRERNDFLPELDKIPLSVCNKAKIMYLNYPNNPTTALANEDFLKRVVEFCSKYGIILVYDNAYSEVYFNDKPKSILEIPQAQEVAIEFHSFSKTFCMTGFRVGWACGNPKLISILLKVKTSIDSGIFGAIQDAALAGFKVYNSYNESLRTAIIERKDILIKKLKQAGLRKFYADSTFYVWVKVPRKFNSSMDYAQYLMTEKSIVATPGLGFGKYGEGFIRFALTVDKDILENISF